MAESEKRVVETSPSGREVVTAPQVGGNEISTGLETIFDEFRRSFDDLMSPFLPMRVYRPRTFGVSPIRAPLVDVVDEGERYVIKTELPGYEKEDVDVELNKDLLILKAEKKVEAEEKSQNYLHRERTYSACHRAINFPEEVDPSKVEGTMKNGVLELMVPKREPKPEERLTRVLVK
ncbi:MAG: Hsp20/alpha crystallin family protein [Methanothrix sp.]|nr:Hsp20/alpha crystallin family protein [Methanothrix harundinacea]MDD3566000.1 Hsp20/alpha crystallin family protein [Methanothrix sp.]MDD5515711.1 Hsp20/alpha crystallin family protein [Synergistales bacterium]MDI9398982.1 Hsp20/alpha crystallin family protein [Euryarchaeota archaeon]